MRTLILFFLTLLAVELGLRLRLELNSIHQRDKFFNSSPSLKRQQVIFYGDSILGGMMQPLSSLLNFNEINVIDKTGPTLRTEKINQLISFDLDRYQPDLVVFMVGKADLDVPEKNILLFPAFQLWMHHHFFLYRYIEECTASGWERLANFVLGAKQLYRSLLDISLNKQKKSCDVSQQKNVLDANGKMRRECWNYLSQLSNKGQAVRALDQIESMRKYPLSFDEHNKLLLRKATLFARLGKDEEAKQILNKIGRDPEFIYNSSNIKDYLRTLLWLKDYEQLESYIRSLPLKKQNRDDVLIYHSWSVQGRVGCKESIPLFEKSFARSIITRNQMLALVSCYKAMHQVKVGGERLAQLYQNVSLKPKVDGVLAQFFFSMGNVEKAQNILKKNKMNDPNNSSLQDRDIYKSQLALYSYLGDDENLNKIFREQDFVQMRRSAFVSISSYRRILEKVKEKGVHLLVLQYPNEREELLELQLGLPGLQIVSTRQFILDELNHYHLKEIFQSDFEHLTSRGACIVSRGVVKAIVHQLKPERQNKQTQPYPEC